VNFAKLLELCASRVLASIFDIDQGTLGLEGFGYGCTVLHGGGAISFLNLGPLKGGPFLAALQVSREKSSPHPSLLGHHPSLLLLGDGELEQWAILERPFIGSAVLWLRRLLGLVSLITRSATTI
jgi:hypothetical protein